MNTRKLNKISLRCVYTAISVMPLIPLAVNLGRAMGAFNVSRLSSRLISLLFLEANGANGWYGGCVRYPLRALW